MKVKKKMHDRLRPRPSRATLRDDRKHSETSSSRIVLVLERPVHAGCDDLVATFAASRVLAAASGCSHRAVARTRRRRAKIGATETGIASWYGDPYNGRRAASGEIYDMEQLTAAHRTLPFQTWVEVTDLDNGKRVNVRITDRGPFVDGRIIDLSLAAARKIEMVGPGIARVKLKVIPPPQTRDRAASEPIDAPNCIRSKPARSRREVRAERSKRCCALNSTIRPWSQRGTVGGC